MKKELDVTDAEILGLVGGEEHVPLVYLDERDYPQAPHVIKTTFEADPVRLVDVTKKPPMAKEEQLARLRLWLETLSVRDLQRIRQKCYDRRASGKAQVVRLLDFTYTPNQIISAIRDVGIG